MGLLVLYVCILVSCEGKTPALRLDLASWEKAYAGREGAFVLIDCATLERQCFRPEAAARRLPPCSTFKVWNSLIGLELGLVAGADEPFYKWDGQRQPYPDWQKDLTFKEAFRVSCVPAFQAFARRVGESNMRSWVERLGYGDRDVSAGVDAFWLPRPGRKTLLVSPREQAERLAALARGTLPFKKRAVAVVKELMECARTPHGVLYGKTGTGVAQGEELGWFVGLVEGPRGHYSFACAVLGKGQTGKATRALVESELRRAGLL